MKREITDHRPHGCDDPTLNDELQIHAHDLPGEGGASQFYTIRPIKPLTTEDVTGSCQRSRACVDIQFQAGALNEHGPSGVSNEALLAIVIDRLSGFKHGPFSSRENSTALTHIQSALMWLQKRTRERSKRGVEGKLEA